MAMNLPSKTPSGSWHGAGLETIRDVLPEERRSVNFDFAHYGLWVSCSNDQKTSSVGNFAVAWTQFHR